jgi:hypothetical protein
MVQSLAQYTVAGARALRGQHVFGMPTDKATISGLPMQISVVVVSTNVAVLCPPAVLVHVHALACALAQSLLSRKLLPKTKPYFCSALDKKNHPLGGLIFDLI